MEIYPENSKKESSFLIQGSIDPLKETGFLVFTSGQLKYARVKHYLKLNEAKKPVFEYNPKATNTLMINSSIFYRKLTNIVT